MLKWIVKCLLPVALLGHIFYPTFLWMADRWMARDSYFGHGVLIPLVALYWIFKKKDQILRVEKKSDPWGLFVLILGVSLQAVSSVLRIYFLSGLAFVIILLGTIQFLFGSKALGLIWFPVSFLFLMVPLPLLVISEVTLKLKFFVSEVSAYLLRSIGIKAVREGSYIYMPHAYLLVGDPCSGLRSILAFLCLGPIFAYGSGLDWEKKALLVGSGFPLALLSNIVRVFFLALLSEIYGMEIIFSWVHDASGFGAFIFAVLAFFYFRKRLEPVPPLVAR